MYQICCSNTGLHVAREAGEDPLLQDVAEAVDGLRVNRIIAMNRITNTYIYIYILMMIIIINKSKQYSYKVHM